MQEIEMKPRKEKKLGRIPEMRVEESLELDLLRRASFENRSLTNYVLHIINLHLYGVVRTAKIESGEDDGE